MSVKQTLNVTESELLTILMEIQKSTFIHLVTTTKPKMRKTDNPYFEKVIKRSSCNYLCGNDYSDRVGTNYEKEGINPETFVVETPKGKEHITKCVLKDTKTGEKRYFMVERFNEIKPQVEYFFEGNPIEKELFESFLSEKYESKKQEQDRKVYPITFDVSNIQECTLNGTKYIVQR